MRRATNGRKERKSRLPFGFERQFRRLSRRAQFFGLGMFSLGPVVIAAAWPIVVEFTERFGEGVVLALLLVWTASCWVCARLLDVLWPPTDPPPRTRNRRRWERAELEDAYATLWFGHTAPLAFLGVVGVVALVVVCYLSGNVLWASVLAVAMIGAFLLVRILMLPRRPSRRRT